MSVAINLLVCIFLRDAGGLLSSGASVISHCCCPTLSRKNGVETSVPLYISSTVSEVRHSLLQVISLMNFFGCCSMLEAALSQVYLLFFRCFSDDVLHCIHQELTF